MKEKILQTLHELRKYALAKGYDVTLDYHEEDSSLMRFANSAISLNTNEHLIRLSVTAYEGRKRASYDLITDLGKLAEMKKGIDTAAEMVKHAQPLDYQPTVPVFTKNPSRMITGMKRLFPILKIRRRWSFSTRRFVEWNRK